MPTSLRRALTEFLAVPLLVIAGFLALAVALLLLDGADVAGLDSLRSRMSELVFGDANATSDLLATIAGSIITVTSITFSLLLLAVQQSASTLTHEVFDQFLRRRANQAFLGVFVGLAVYALVVLSATHEGFNPVLSASVALLLAILAVVLLAVIVYTTIDQMRPPQIVEAVHDHMLRARERQLELIGRFRETARTERRGQLLRAGDDGFVTRIDADALQATLDGHDAVEVVLHVSIGRFVAYGDVLAEIRGPADERLADGVHAAIRLDRVRDIGLDPGAGIEQLVNIAWTTISTSKQNPGPGRLVVFALRDLLGRWAVEPPPQHAGETLPVVYEDDVLDTLWDALESIAVVCSESMQTQNVAELLRSVALVHPRLTPPHEDRAAALAMVMLATLGDHVPTSDLDEALERLAGALEARHPREAATVRTARAQLGENVGSLNSRATRVPSGA